MAEKARAVTDPEKDSTRLVSYNVHACVGRDRRFMPERILAILEQCDADVIALQEVENRSFRGTPVVEFLARNLGLHAYPGSTLRRGDADYGNLLLAKQEPDALRMHDISVPGAEPRGAIEADFTFGGRRIKFVSTHLGLTGPERKKQVLQLLPAIEQARSDVIVMAGDFNEWRPRSFPLRALRSALGPGSAARTFPAATPVLALDRFYVSPWDIVLNCQVMKTDECRKASDHLPLICDLRLSRRDVPGDPSTGEADS